MATQLLRLTAVASLSLLALAAGLLPESGKTVPLLLPLDGSAPDAGSRSPMLSARGGVVAFASLATNLVSDDTDGLRDIVIARLKKSLRLCASVSSAGIKADGDSDDPVLDRRGHRVTFVSTATNLVDGDTNGQADIFVRDLKHGTTVLVSQATDGTQADGPSEQPWISVDGRCVVFASRATNLVPDDTNGASDIFLHVLKTGVTTRVSVAPDGSQLDGDSVYPRLSATGRWLAFLSAATDLVPADANQRSDVFVRNMKTGAVEAVSVATDGTLADGDSGHLSITANGRFVAFDSAAGNLSPDDGNGLEDVFLRDRKKHVTTLVSQAPEAATTGRSVLPALSATGKWIAYSSDADNLVAGDTNGMTDIFRKRFKTGVTERMSVSSQGVEGNANSDQATISRNGKFVLFSTRATNLFDLEQGNSGGVWQIALRAP